MLVCKFHLYSIVFRTNMSWRITFMCSLFNTDCQRPLTLTQSPALQFQTDLISSSGSAKTTVLFQGNADGFEFNICSFHTMSGHLTVTHFSFFFFFSQQQMLYFTLKQSLYRYLYLQIQIYSYRYIYKKCHHLDLTKQTGKNLLDNY